jgi:YesN/AraC family two-component response regulator
LKQTFDHIPDIIICDIIIPGKNGLELTKIFKADIRTSHIPVILLTARGSGEQKLEGIKTGADAYITKPFEFNFLEQQLTTILHNRDKSKSHFSSEVVTGSREIALNNNNRKFVSDFAAIVEKNISNDAFSIENICSELNISHVQLSRKIKAYLNCNVNEYITRTRLQKAKYYLQHEDLSISEIAFKTGFSSATYFATVFKSKFSVTPKEFKEKKIKTGME